MTADKKSRLGRVADAITDAAKATAHAADDYVVQPVGQALGLIPADAEQPPTKSARKASRKAAVQRMAKTPAGRMLTQRVVRTMTQPGAEAPAPRPGKKTPPRGK
jgi:nucleoside phosphorylase